MKTPGRGSSDLKAAGEPAAPPAPPLSESQIERLLKLVPGDVVALYIPALALGKLTAWRYYALTVAIAATVAVPLFLYLDARRAKERVPVLQYVVRTIAFIAWALVISSPLGEGVVHPIIPALIAIVLPVVAERVLRQPAAG